MNDFNLHWTKLLAPIPAPDPFANKNPQSPWLELNIKLQALGYW